MTDKRLTSSITGRPWGLVKNKVRKDYPSIQLTAWKVGYNELIINLFSQEKMQCHSKLVKLKVWLYAVLANSWLDQLSVHAPAVTCSVPQLYCFMLVSTYIFPSPIWWFWYVSPSSNGSFAFMSIGQYYYISTNIFLSYYIRAIFLNLKARSVTAKKD